MTWLLKNTSSITFSVEQTAQNLCFVGDTGDFKNKAWCLNCNQTVVSYFTVCNDLIQNAWVTVYSVHHILVIEDMTLPFEISWNNVHPSPCKTPANTHTHTHTCMNKWYMFRWSFRMRWHYHIFYWELCNSRSCFICFLLEISVDE